MKRKKLTCEEVIKKAIIKKIKKEGNKNGTKERRETA